MATTSRFPAKSTASPTFTRLASTAASMYFLLALANTSASAPWASCWASCCEPAKLKERVTPGFFCSNAAPSSPNASIKEDAARTVNVLGFACGGAEAPPAEHAVKRRRITSEMACKDFNDIQRFSRSAKYSMIEQLRNYNPSGN